MRNPYEVLGLSQDASIDDVKRAYRDLARIYNNDYQKMVTANSPVNFNEIVDKDKAKE